MQDRETQAHHHRRFHLPHSHLSSPFGEDVFGRSAERFARLFGTPKFLVAQSVVVAGWLAVNAAVVALRWDPYPFILLNLAFSTQAAYAAPFILLAQTRQADRERTWSEADSRHRESLAQDALLLIRENVELIREVKALSERIANLTEEVHGKVAGQE